MLTFDEWMAEVDKYVQEKMGLSVYDLPDQPYADWYEDGMTPKQAARLAIRGAMENMA